MTYPHALITGGSSGIGLAIARKLLQRGMNVSLIARRPGLLQEARAQLGGGRDDARIFTASADVSVPAAAGAAVNAAISRFGPPAWLVTSAGMVQPGTFASLTAESFERTMSVNYLGTVYTIKAALPAMRGTGGHIVLISSGAALIGLYGYTAYAPSKFALRGFAEALQAELRHQGIGVSIAFPPDTDTPQLEEENRLRPAETRLMTGVAGLWSAERVAESILRDVQRGRFAITPGPALSVLYALGGVLSPLLQGYWAWRVGRMQRQRARLDMEERKT